MISPDFWFEVCKAFRSLADFKPNFFVRLLMDRVSSGPHWTCCRLSVLSVNLQSVKHQPLNGACSHILCYFYNYLIFSSIQIGSGEMSLSHFSWCSTQNWVRSVSGCTVWMWGKSAVSDAHSVVYPVLIKCVHPVSWISSGDGITGCRYDAVNSIA